MYVVEISAINCPPEKCRGHPEKKIANDMKNKGTVLRRSAPSPVKGKARRIPGVTLDAVLKTFFSAAGPGKRLTGKANNYSLAK
ncbi:hypothetical protein CHL67_11445 [Prosthecochloris sp. GSB1]|nr:hypothetical protein CHL67_11445 [Prosthecochloris sp. GSB1]